jgi:hypothetical protein
MATTLSGSWSAFTTNGVSAYFSGLSSSDVLIITFSDGIRVAISNYIDEESGDAIVGIPQDNLVNFSAWTMHNGGTFTVYEYTDDGLGAAIHTYTHTDANNAGAFRLEYEPATQGLTILYSASTTGVPDDFGNYSSFVGATLSSSVVCFLRGTRILTDRGEVAVEELREGDLVATRFGGLRPIAWIGTQSFDARFAGRTHAPIRFAPGSLGQGMPRAALFVSPGHAMLVPGALEGDALVHAAALVNGDTITQPTPQGTIDYFHLDLAGHDCVLANGTWAESYFEDRNRAAFHNAATYPAGHAPTRQATCLPILTATHPDLSAIRERLLSAPASLQLLADGRVLTLAEIAPGTWQATIPAGTTRLRLRSPAFRTQGEARTLGLMVHALALDGAPLAPEGQGWHDAEPGWTWTNGNADLPPRPGSLTLQAWWPEVSARRAA